MTMHLRLSLLSLLAICSLLVTSGCKTVAKQTSAFPITELPPTSASSGPKMSLPSEKLSLNNGLSVILSEDHSTPFVSVNIWYGVGAVHEQPHRTGLAHFFEHLMFEGSKHVKEGEHFSVLENAGASDLNASTSFDRTNYYQTVPKSQLELVLNMESSRMFWLVINPTTVQAQRDVVKNERRQRYETSPYGNALLKLWENIFPKNHPYHGQVIGSHEDLEAATIEDIQAFYDRYYSPSNATITIVGDFERNHALALIEKYFATLPKTPVPALPALPEVKITKQEIIRVDEKIGQLPLIRMQYITPALFWPGDADMDLLAHVLTGTQNARLTKALTRDKPLANSISASQQSFAQTSVFSIDALLNPGVDENEVIKELDRVLADLATHPITQVELDQARNATLTDMLFSLQKLGGYGGRSELLQAYNRFAGRPDFLQADINRYQAVTSDSITKAALKYVPAAKARKVLIAKPASFNIALQKHRDESFFAAKGNPL